MIMKIGQTMLKIKKRINKMQKNLKIKSLLSLKKKKVRLRISKAFLVVLLSKMKIKIKNLIQAQALVLVLDFHQWISQQIKV